MLVLSRRQGQRILFPGLDVAVQVLSSKGAAVRLGIDAPSSVAVLREELPHQVVRSKADGAASHEFRGRLNLLSMTLHVAEKQLTAGLTADAERTLREAQSVIEKLPLAPANPVREPRGKSLRTLLVEDNPNEEALLSSYLRLSGFRVETVHDGGEALEFLASQERPDFLLLDMRLPRFDGPATVESIRQNPAYRGLTIFAVTGSAPAEFTLPLGPTGVDAWFQKPLNPKRIVDAMSAAVSRN
jgi:carbon storage regulator CsrA